MGIPKDRFSHNRASVGVNLYNLVDKGNAEFFPGSIFFQIHAICTFCVFFLCVNISSSLSLILIYLNAQQYECFVKLEIML